LPGAIFRTVPVRDTVFFRSNLDANFVKNSAPGAFWVNFVQVNNYGLIGHGFWAENAPKYPHWSKVNARLVKGVKRPKNGKL